MCLGSCNRSAFSSKISLKYFSLEIGTPALKKIVRSTLANHIKSVKHNECKKKLKTKQGKEIEISTALKKYDESVNSKGQTILDEQRVYRVKVIFTERVSRHALQMSLPTELTVSSSIGSTFTLAEGGTLGSFSAKLPLDLFFPEGGSSFSLINWMWLVISINPEET